MKVGPVEITLIHPEDGSEFEERVVEGKNYFVAEIGREFKVRVTVNNFDGIYPKDEFIRVGLFLDGIFVSYYIMKLQLLARQSITFLCHGLPSDDHYDAFEFKGQAFTFDALPDNPDSKIGTVSLIIDSVQNSGSKKRTKFDAKVMNSGFKIKNQKKLWQQPSASTGIGRKNVEKCVQTPHIFISDDRYHQEITIPYHTADVLDRWEKSLTEAKAVETVAASASAAESVTSTSTVEAPGTQEGGFVGAKKRKVDESGQLEADKAAQKSLQH